MSTLVSDSPASRGQEHPPAAKKVPHVAVVHGERRVDDYFWLREKTNPDTPAYLEAENAYADAVMKPTEGLQKQLYDEMVGHIKETDVAAPVRDGAWWYYSRTEKGLQYPLLCRKPAGAADPPHPRTPEDLPAAEKLYLDLNQLASGHPFLGMGATAISDDGNLLAYSVDFTGFRQYTLHVMDLRSGEVLPDMAEKVGSVAWAADNRTLFYTIEDHAKRQYRVYRHTLDQTSDDLIYEDTDERFNVDVARSRSKRFLFIVSGSHTTTEARFLEARDPAGAWRIVAPRRQDHEYDIDHHGGEFLIRTNDQGRNFRVVATPVDSPGEQNWRELVPHRPEVMIADLLAFQDFYVLHEREDGLPHFRVTRFESGEAHRIDFPEPVYAAFPAANREYETRFFRYAYQSLVTPSSIYDYEVERRASVLIKEQEVPGYDKAQYVSERLWATAADGVRIPLSLVYRKDRPRDGSRPLLLTGYGAYGFAIPANFSSNLLSLLDRGFAFAVAHIRGGGEMGKPWHDQGRMMKKKTPFTDFIAASEALIAQRYTSPEHLAIQGGSAGGLLMGAVVNLRPELFRAVISKVPFVDVVNTMLDASLPLTIPEYEEWGNPNQEDEYAYLRSYAPYDNLEKKSYPAMLVKTSFNDSQVMYHEPAKYVARLRTLKTDGNVLLLKTNMAAGHGGASGRYDFLKEIAFDYAFLLEQLGATEAKN